MMLKLEHARKMVAAAGSKARELGIAVVVAVVDEGTNLVLLERMDEALLVSLAVAQDKAYTAAAVKCATRDLSESTQPGGENYGFALSAGGRVMVFPGGLPIVVDGRVVGGIGVSGGSGDQDEECAQAGVEAL